MDKISVEQRCAFSIKLPLRNKALDSMLDTPGGMSNHSPSLGLECYHPTE